MAPSLFKCGKATAGSPELHYDVIYCIEREEGSQNFVVAVTDFRGHSWHALFSEEEWWKAGPEKAGRGTARDLTLWLREALDQQPPDFHLHHPDLEDDRHKAESFMYVTYTFPWDGRQLPLRLPPTGSLSHSGQPSEMEVVGRMLLRQCEEERRRHEAEEAALRQQNAGLAQQLTACQQELRKLQQAVAAGGSLLPRSPPQRHSRGHAAAVTTSAAVAQQLAPSRGQKASPDKQQPTVSASGTATAGQAPAGGAGAAASAPAAEQPETGTGTAAEETDAADWSSLLLVRAPAAAAGRGGGARATGRPKRGRAG